MTKTEKQHEIQMRVLAEVVAAVAAGRTAATYRPTFPLTTMANAFDAAMQVIGSPVRAWRGSEVRS